MCSVIIAMVVLSATEVLITQPEDGGVYDGDWLTLNALVDNEGLLPDSVTFSLNGGSLVPVPRLCTDWHTYMQNDLHHGFSEAPAPHDPTVLWAAPVCGTFHEFPNPVIVDGIVYYPANFGSDSLYALDAATGEIIWKYLIGRTDDAVTVREGFLYIASRRSLQGVDSLWCLDAQTGARIWASAAAGFHGSTPCVVDGKVYAGTIINDQASISRFDASTGEVQWTRVLTEKTASCMTVWEGMLFVPTYTNTGGAPSPIYALDASNGETIWSRTVNKGFWDSSPVVADSTIYIGTLDGLLLAIDCLTGEILWELPFDDDITATPAYHDGSIYIGSDDTGEDGQFVRVDAETGQVQWSVAFSIHGSPCVADGLVFFGEVQSGSESRLIALDCATGETVWTYTVESYWFAGTPAVTDGVLYMPAHDGFLYAFGTGIKWTYRDDLYAQVGLNQLVVNSWSGGSVAASDTVTFTVTQTGIEPEPAPGLNIMAFPNPFTRDALLSFQTVVPGHASIRVFDLSGRPVKCLVERETLPGLHSVTWTPDPSVPSGCYLITLESAGETVTKRCVFLR